jgi:hypothetical protein
VGRKGREEERERKGEGTGNLQKKKNVPNIPKFLLNSEQFKKVRIRSGSWVEEEEAEEVPGEGEEAKVSSSWERDCCLKEIAS